MGNTGSCGEAGRVLTQGPPSESWGLYTHGWPCFTEVPRRFPHWQPAAAVIAALWPRPPQGSG